MCNLLVPVDFLQQVSAGDEPSSCGPVARSFSPTGSKSLTTVANLHKTVTTAGLTPLWSLSSAACLRPQF